MKNLSRCLAAGCAAAFFLSASLLYGQTVAGLSRAAAPEPTESVQPDLVQLYVDTVNGNSPYTVGANDSYSFVHVGTNSGGVVNQTGSNNLSATSLTVGDAATGTYNLSGTGTLSISSTTTVGYQGSATFNHTSGTNASNVMQIGSAGIVGTYNLNGGTLSTAFIFGFGASGGGQSIFYFNGGTLKATANRTDFFETLTTAQVRNNAAIIDTNGHNVTIHQALVDSTIGGDNTVDGGLTKNGAGALTLAAQNTFNGGTRVNAGTLIVGDGTHTSSLIGYSPATSTQSGSNAVTINNAAAFQAQAHGSVTGGTGANGVQFIFPTSTPATPGGNGGIGVIFQSGGSLINGGTINGGAGGHGGNGFDPDTSPGANGGNGGDGVSMNGGGSVTNSSSIHGGAAGIGGNNGGTDGTAGVGVRFSGAAGTLANDSGGSISNGVVMGNFANAVTLEIGSTVTGALNLGPSTASTLTLTDDGTNVGPQLYSTAVSGTTTFSGSLVKNGSGAWTLDKSFSYGGGTTVNAGTLTVNNSLGSGLFAVAANSSTVNNGTIGGNVSVSGMFSGCGTILGSLSVNLGGIANFDGCAVTVNGPITNDGLLVLRGGATLTGNSPSFTNHGTLDLSTAGTFARPGFTNSGAIIDATVIRVKSVQKSSRTVTVAIDSYTGHSYQLQKSTTTPAGASFSNLDPPQQGSTGTLLNFSDSAATGPVAFYRIIVE